MDGFETVVEKVGSRIRQFRTAQGLTQAQLAEKAGVFDVGEIERGKKVRGGPANPRLETLHKIARALGIELEELFGYSVPSETATRITELLEGQSDAVKEKAVRLVSVMVG